MPKQWYPDWQPNTVIGTFLDRHTDDYNRFHAGHGFRRTVRVIRANIAIASDEMKRLADIGETIFRFINRITV